MMTFKQRAAVILSNGYENLNADKDLELQSMTRDNGDYIFLNLRRKSGTKIISDSWNRINKNQCRSCEKEMQPYTENFFELQPSLIDTYILYCFENGYCRECAEKLSQKKHLQPKQVIRTTTQQIAGDKYPTYIKYFADGSIEETNDSNRSKLHK